MAAAHDLVIRNGEVFDGLGGPGFTGDIAIGAGRIVQVGKVAGGGKEEIDAKGKIVTPGFVDVHTHYDGQVTWSSYVDPSSSHGTTTVVMGNCSVGFAPVRTQDHDSLIDLMEGVEDIPGAAMFEGLRWNWSSFPEYLDAVDALPHDIDVCAQLPHSAMRLFVMGDRALRHEPATTADIVQMRGIVAEAMRAGGFGVSTSRTAAHRAASGVATLGLDSEEREILGIAQGIQDAGSGVLEMVSDWNGDRAGDFAMLRRIVEKTGVALSLSVSQHMDKPRWWRTLLTNIEAAHGHGLPISGQVPVRAIGMILSLESNVHSFAYHPSYRPLRERPLREKVAAMRDPEFKRRLLTESAALSGHPYEAHRAKFHDQLHMIFPMGEYPEYEPTADQSLAALSAETGRPALEIMYDQLLSDDGHGLLYQPHINYFDGNLDTSREMLMSSATVPGIGDGGAHVGMICDASNTTFLLTHWGRDRSAGRFDLGWLIKRQTADTAQAIGLADRGVLKPGMKADLNVIDFARLRVMKPRMHYDLPAGGKRLLQEAQGYDATLVSGVVMRCDDQATGALPGRLVRGGRPVQAAVKP